MRRDSAVASKSWGVAFLSWIEKRISLQEMSRDSEEMARDWTSFALCLVVTRKFDTFASKYLGVTSISKKTMRTALGVIGFPERVPDGRGEELLDGQSTH